MEWLSKITSRAARRLNRPKASAKLHNPLHITKLFDEKIWHKKREHHRNHTQTPYNQQIIKKTTFFASCGTAMRKESPLYPE